MTASGGTGTNLFALAQQADRFRPLSGYGTYLQGSQFLNICSFAKSLPVENRTAEEPAKEIAVTEERNTARERTFSVYPNPSDGMLRFLSSEEMLERVTVLSADGKTVFDGRKLSASRELDLQQLPAGIYYVKVLFNDNSIRVEKVIRQ